MVPQTKVFVGGLSQGSRPEDLRKLFERFGVVTECDIMNRCGFVHMETEEQASAAIRALNNTTFNGAPISVERGRIKERGARGGGGGGRGRGGMRGGMERRGGGPMRGGPPFMRDAPYSRDRGMQRGPPSSMPYDRERAPPSGYDDRYNGYGGEDRRGFSLMDRGARDPYAAPMYGDGRYDEMGPMYDDRRAPMYDERDMMDRRPAMTPYERAMPPRAAPMPNGDMFSRRSPMHAAAPGGYDRTDPYAQPYPAAGRHAAAPGGYDRGDPYAQQYPAMGRGGGGAARDRDMAGMGPRRY